MGQQATGGRTISDLEREAAGRRLDYDSSWAAVCAIVAAGATFAALGVAADPRTLLVPIRVGVASSATIPWRNIRSATTDFGVLLEIERIALLDAKSFGEATAHLLAQSDDLTGTINKIRGLRDFNDEREHKLTKRLRAVCRPRP